MKLKLVSTVAVTSLAAWMMACGSDGAQGPAGEPGPAGPAAGGKDPIEGSVSLVTPNKGVLDREVEVSIGGSATKFADGVKPDFGEGIEVLEVVRSSPTLLTARLRIAKTAPLGARKVTIGDLVAEDAFRVVPALQVASPSKGEQGGLGMVEFENADATAFDANAFAVEAAGLVPYAAQASNPFAGAAFFLVPPLASPGRVAIEARNLDAKGAPRVSFLSGPDAFEVSTRIAADLALGTAKSAETLATDLSSKLYKVSTTASQDGILTLRLHVADGEQAVLSTALWDSGGQAKDLLARFDAVEDGFFGPQPKQAPYDLVYSIPVASAPSKSFFLTVLDYAGTVGAKFDVHPSSVTATVVNEGGAAHATQETAEAITVAAPGAGTLLKGEITEDGGFDWYKFTVAEGETVEVGLHGLEGQAGVNDGSDFVAVTSGGPKLFGTGALSAPLAAGERFVAVVGKKGQYTLTLRRHAPAN